MYKRPSALSGDKRDNKQQPAGNQSARTETLSVGQTDSRGIQTILERGTGNELSQNTALQLQRTIGNRALQQMLGGQKVIQRVKIQSLLGNLETSELTLEDLTWIVDRLRGIGTIVEANQAEQFQQAIDNGDYLQAVPGEKLGVMENEEGFTKDLGTMEEEEPKQTLEQIVANYDSGEDSDYMEEEESENIFKPKKARKKKQKSVSSQVATFDMFKEKGSGMKKRPSGYGPVTIDLEQINHASGEINRPKQVSGIVYPTATKGRPTAPEPISGIQVGIKWKEVGTMATRNTGIVDAQKGHIMALELGGPDIPENIVPQWGNWQANGVWRKAETRVLELAKELEQKNLRLHFTAEIRYKKYHFLETATLKGATFPTGFTITVREVDSNNNVLNTAGKIMFDEGQTQDQTDFKISGRVFDQLDEQEMSYSDSD